MTVEECVRLAAELLGIEKEISPETETETGMRKAALLLTCYNIVENELALDYLPLTAEDTIRSNTGVIEYESLKYPVVRIVEVKDGQGENVDFHIFAKYLKTETGTVTVRYTYTPSKKTMEEESDFTAPVSSRLIAYGIAAEYAMANGLFEDASVWEKKYKQAIENAYRLQPCVRIRSRRWV